MLKRRGRLTALAGSLVAALVLVLAGCGSQAATTTPSNLPSQVTLVGGIQTEPNWWFAFTSLSTCSTSNFGIGLMYRPLLYISAQDTVDYARSIASSVSVSNNDTTFTVHLKPSWHWSNGQPITSADVLYAWDILDATSQSTAVWENCGVGIGGLPAKWKSVTAPNPETVVIQTTVPVNPVWFEINGIAQLAPIPKAVWDHTSNMKAELTWIEANANKPLSPLFKVTDGPYQITKFVNNEYWEFTANPNYSGHKAQIKKLIFDYETGDPGVFLGLRKGTLDQANLPPEYAVDRSQLKGYRIVNAGYAFGINYMQLNMSAAAPNGIGSVFSHLYVREALQMGIDQNAIVQKLYDGYAHTEYGPVPPEPPNAFYDPAVKKWPYNPKAGLKLLEAHGWKMVNGVLMKNGKPFTFQLLFMSGTITDNNIVQLLKNDWAQEGIQVTLKSEPFNQVIAATPSQYQAEWWGAGWYYGPDFYPTGGTLYKCGGGFTPPGYCNAHMDQLINATYGPGTPAQEQQRLDAYQIYVSQQLPVLWLPEYIGVGTPSAFQAVKPWLHGVVKWYNPIEGGPSYNRWTISN